MPELDNEERGQLLFLSFLPLVNGLADFASIGLTRWSLRKGVQGMLPWSWVIDLAGAVVIFFGLGAVIILFIHMAQPGGVPLLSLEVLFAEIKGPATRGQYWWLLFMLFSTLIPTVLHGVVAATAFFTIYPKPWRLRITAWLRDAPEDAIAARGGRVTLALAFTLAFFVPVFLIVEAVRWWPGILNGTIWVFEGFACLIGAA
ncbi:hypothetical protein [Candidatus Rhodobacter oscarellae]|nr:hypothetical protein [Candidatus Rhodobacter lobularis]